MRLSEIVVTWQVERQGGISRYANGQLPQIRILIQRNTLVGGVKYGRINAAFL